MPLLLLLLLLVLLLTLLLLFLSFRFFAFWVVVSVSVAVAVLAAFNCIAHTQNTIRPIHRTQNRFGLFMAISCSNVRNTVEMVEISYHNALLCGSFLRLTAVRYWSLRKIRFIWRVLAVFINSINGKLPFLDSLFSDASLKIAHQKRHSSQGRLRKAISLSTIVERLK